MPISLDYVNSNEGVILRYSGVTTGRQMLKSYRDIYNNQEYPQLKYIISDRTNSDSYDVEPHHISRLAQMTKDIFPVNPDVCYAIVSKKALEFGMARMYQLLTEEFGFKVVHFEEMAEAQNWVAEQIRTD